ncbi:MAG: hypothetical protein KAJ51_07630, partial [Thermoplasmata archaeon]|nr:hypothetical protein [Thermoplasmata archaeon]
LSEYFDGIIDEVAIYNRALTNDEIKYNYQNGLIINQKEGDLTSEQITIPPLMYWNTLIINKTEPPKTYLNITILDAVTNQSIESYDNLTGANIDISSINTHIHNSIKLQAKFESNGTVTPILHDWSLNWTPNKPPIVLTFQSASNTVFRTNTTQLTINISDYEDTVNNLTVDIKYRSPVDLIWQDLFLTEQNSYEKHLNVNFTPDKNADLGDYSFNVSCNDSFQEFNYKIFNNVITVLNNPPTAPDVIITPTIPKTLDDLTATAYNVTDLEDEPIVHYYEWYKDDELQLELNTDLVPSEYTTQNEVWKCIVTPSDGNENGTTGEAEVIVQNTAPEINQSLLSVTF